MISCIIPLISLLCSSVIGVIFEGIERLHIGELFRACGIIDLIKYLRPLLAHDVHILGVELREVIGVGQRHDVQRIREAAHEILLTRCFLGRVVQTGINNEMF